MSETVPAFPTRPDEIPHGVGLGQLVDAYNTHQYEVLVGTRVRPGDPDVVFAHAAATLALLHTLVDRLQAARWSTVRAALAADARRGGDVATACGLDSTEVAAGLRSWADGQVSAGLIDSREWRVVDLLARSVEEARR